MSDIHPDFRIAHAIAEQLVRANTDHNELAKASAYLNHVHDADAFFTWLDWMATAQISNRLARSRQTPIYFRAIRDACQALRAVGNAKTMALTLAWAVRLMRYIPRAKPIPPEASVALAAPQPASSPRAEPQETSAGPPERTVAHPTSLAEVKPDMWLEGRVLDVEHNRIVVDVGWKRMPH
ncbi:MAG TPA: hypothetical protein EYP04_02215 [Anaerolineae bacterium]|nr:hypothetical protein [Anaerolineae bacterium]